MKAACYLMLSLLKLLTLSHFIILVIFVAMKCANIVCIDCSNCLFYILTHLNMNDNNVLF